ETVTVETVVAPVGDAPQAAAMTAPARTRNSTTNDLNCMRDSCNGRRWQPRDLQGVRPPRYGVLAAQVRANDGSACARHTSPTAALAVGLKVDVDALPRNVRAQLEHGGLDLNDPAVTVALLRLNAVVGVSGVFDSAGRLSSVGIQCAFCHSTVDDSAPSLCF